MTTQPAPAAPPPPTDSPEPSDDALLAAVAAGDAAALGALYDRYRRLAYVVAYRVLEDTGAAEDAVQDAFLAIWRRVDSYQSARGPVKGWLLAVVRNAAVDRRRGRESRLTLAASLDDVAYRLMTSGEETLAAVTSAIESARIREALNLLPSEQREAIELAYFGGLTHQEIAARTGAPLGTVKGRLRLGLHKLRALLADLLPPDATETAPDDPRSIHREDAAPPLAAALTPSSSPRQAFAGLISPAAA